MNLDELRKIIASPATSPKEREAVLAAVRANSSEPTESAAAREKRLADEESALLRAQFWNEYLAECDPSELARQAEIIDLCFNTTSEGERRALAARELRTLRATADQQF